MKLPNKKKSKHEKDELTIVSTFMDLLEGQQDTTSTALSYLAYELTKNPEVQKTLQEEIDQAFYESGGEIPDYNVIQNLPFLEMVIYETLRVHPPVGLNFRVVNKDYNLPGTDIVLKTNDMVSWNARSLHFDPEHWTNPTEFYPEHFSKEEKANRSP
jgi:cytochrome P450